MWVLGMVMWVLGMEVAAPAGSFMSPPLSTILDKDGDAADTDKDTDTDKDGDEADTLSLIKK